MFRAFGHPVATCCVLLAQVWNKSNLSQQHTTCRNTSQHGGQTHATCCAQQCCDMLCWHVAIVWPGLCKQVYICRIFLLNSRNAAFWESTTTPWRCNLPSSFAKTNMAARRIFESLNQIQNPSFEPGNYRLQTSRKHQFMIGERTLAKIIQSKSEKMSDCWL